MNKKGFSLDTTVSWAHTWACNLCGHYRWQRCTDFIILSQYSDKIYLIFHASSQKNIDILKKGEILALVASIVDVGSKSIHWLDI